LAKLEFYGINNIAGKVIKSCLTDRYQRTVLNNNYGKCVSEWQKVKQGVPQGLILGPIFFLLYINDLPYLVNKSSLPILYADDTSILCPNFNFTELVTTLKAILLKINEWFSLNLLTLNLNKTNCVYFVTKLNLLNNLNITYRDTQIHNTGNVKFLGLIIDSTLSWKDISINSQSS
jgi:hypothetical protein